MSCNILVYLSQKESMKNFVKTVVIFVLVNLLFLFFVNAQVVPSFKALDAVNVWWYTELTNIKQDNSLETNIKNLFFPNNSTDKWWYIYNTLAIIVVWIFVFFIVRAWIMFLVNSENEAEIKKARLNLLYLIYWAVIFFGAIWFLWDTLKIGIDETTIRSITTDTQQKIIWWILIFLKSFAYFAAIIMVMYYWFNMVRANDKEDKIKAGKNWVINVLMALAAIKILDYLYFIAQLTEFKTKTELLLVAVSKVLWWIIWVIFIVVLLYAWFLLVTSKWKDDAMKNTLIIIKNVFIAWILIFLFIVIIYDLITNIPEVIK